jgi:lipoyl-dependent peroxiredoxin
MTMTPLFTTAATTKGGRNGRTSLDSGGLALAMALPKEMGGSGDGMNPEQLFALGYATCFGQAILAMGKKHGEDTSDAHVSAEVTIGKDENSFALSVELKVRLIGIDAAKAHQILEDAHQICPYSKATRGNVPVVLTLI